MKKHRKNYYNGERVCVYARVSIDSQLIENVVEHREVQPISLPEWMARRQKQLGLTEEMEISDANVGDEVW